MKTLLNYERQYRQAQQQNRKNDMLPVIPKAKAVTPQSASTDTSDVRKTVAEFDFNTKTIKLMKTNPIYKQELKYDTIDSMYKQVWFVLHSPKLVACTFTTNFYGSTIASMVRYTEMIGLTFQILTSNGKFHSSREFFVWFTEQQNRIEEINLSVENINLITTYARELIRFARSTRTYITVTDTGVTVTSELVEVLKEQIRKSGYDVSMHSVTVQDGLNSGIIEDNRGKHEWSRDYTKHYERYNQTITDLLNMYISCKFYKQAGFEAETDGIGRHDIDSYTGDVITEAIQIHDRDDEVVVPRCACGLGLQNYMN